VATLWRNAVIHNTLFISDAGLAILREKACRNIKIAVVPLVKSKLMTENKAYHPRLGAIGIRGTRQNISWTDLT